MNRKISNKKLQEIIDLAAITSDLANITGVYGQFIVGEEMNGEIGEEYQFAKFESASDAAYAEKVIRAGKEMALELIALRDRVKQLESRNLALNNLIDKRSKEARE